MSALKDYSFEIATVPRARDRVVALWREGLSHEGRPEAKFDWYYGANPAGEPLVVFLCHGESRTAVGTASTGRRLLRVAGKTVDAGLLLDFVVAEGHRTLFPAMALQREMKRVADTTFGTIYGFPNRNSEAAIRRQGFEHRMPIRRWALLLRSKDFLSRRMPAPLASLAGPILDPALRVSRALRAPWGRGWLAQWMPKADERFDELWRRCAARPGVTGVRDAAFLNWRFATFPFERTEFLGLCEPADGRLVAYAACGAAGAAMHVRDFLADPAVPGALAILWREVSRAAHARGHANLSVEFGGDEAVHRSLEAAGFRPRSERPFYVSRASPLLRETWYVTDADEDA